MSGTSQGNALKEALFDVANELWVGQNVQVSFGHPGVNMADDLVVFGGITSNQEPAMMSTLRSRDEKLQVEVVFSVFRGGGADQERVAHDRAFQLLADLEQYVRVTDTTLGGVVLHCFLVGYEATGVTSQQTLATGRETDIVAHFGALARITS